MRMILFGPQSIITNFPVEVVCKRMETHEFEDFRYYKENDRHYVFKNKVLGRQTFNSIINVQIIERENGAEIKYTLIPSPFIIVFGVAAFLLLFFGFVDFPIMARVIGLSAMIIFLLLILYIHRQRFDKEIQALFFEKKIT